MRVLDPDLVDDVDAEVEVDALVAQNVLVLLGDADHLAAVAKRQDNMRSSYRRLYPELFAAMRRARAPTMVFDLVGSTQSKARRAIFPESCVETIRLRSNLPNVAFVTISIWPGSCLIALH